MIKVISFDIGGTLIDSTADNNDNFKIKALSDLINLPYENVRLAYKDVFQKKKGSLTDLVNAFCESLKIKKEAKIIDFFEKKYANTSKYPSISNEKIEIIKTLKSAGYQVILFSNSCCLVPNDSIKVLESFLDGIFYSYDLGHTKSDSESYRYIENKLNRKPEEFLHIGDTLSSDYYSPLKNGWHAVYYGELENSEVESIQDLNKISKILKTK